MKTNELLNLDWRKPESKETLFRALTKLKPLARYARSGFEEGETIPLEALERTICAMARKYDLRVQFITASFAESKGAIYGWGLMKESTSEWLGTVYAMCVQELFAKMTIKMASVVKSGSVGKKSASSNEAERRRRLEASDGEE